jgi:hypothetical protein
MIVNALAKIQIEHLWNTMEELVDIQQIFTVSFILFIICMLQSFKYYYYNLMV